MRWLVSLCCLLILALLPASAHAQDPNGQFSYFTHVEVWGAPDPSMGGNSPLIASYDTGGGLPSNSEMQSAYAAANPGGGWSGATYMVDAASGEMIYIEAAAGDFPSMIREKAPIIKQCLWLSDIDVPEGVNPIYAARRLATQSRR